MKKRILSIVLSLAMIAAVAINPMVSYATDVKIPSNVTFESLGNTLGVHSVSANITTNAATRVNLGAVSSQTTGFQCKVTNPLSVEPTDSKKTFRISLYNTASTNPYAGGYLLELIYVSETQIKWQVAHKNGAVVSLSGTISDLSGEEIMVYAWLNGVDSIGSPQLNVVINDIQIATDYTPLDKGVEYVVQTGNYISAANLWRENMVFKHVAAEIPANVTFEDLGQTAEVNQVKAAAKGATSLGQVSSETTGFKCWVPNPGSVTAGGENRYYLGLYTSKVDAWAGFTLRMSYISADTLKWELLNGNTVLQSGKIDGISGDEVMVYAWLNGKNSEEQALLNVILDDVRILTDATTTRATGTYMSVYNAFADEVLFKNAGTYLAIDSYRSAAGTYTAPIDKAPSEDVVFAGWYEDADYENSIPTTQTTGRAFAKWVPKSVLSVKYQITSGTTLESLSTDFRFVTTVDSLYYKEVGFTITREDKEQPASVMVDTVYESIYESGRPVTAKAAFGEHSAYFMVEELLNMPQADFDLDFTITPTWTTLDGTTVAGVTRTINVAEQLSQMQ